MGLELLHFVSNVLHDELVSPEELFDEGLLGVDFLLRLSAHLLEEAFLLFEFPLQLLHLSPYLLGARGQFVIHLLLPPLLLLDEFAHSLLQAAFYGEKLLLCVFEESLLSLDFLLLDVIDFFVYFEDFFLEVL